MPTWRTFTVYEIGELPWPNTPFRCRFDSEFEESLGAEVETLTNAERASRFQRFIEDCRAQIHLCPYHQVDWKKASEIAIRIFREHRVEKSSDLTPVLREMDFDRELEDLIESFWSHPIEWRRGLDFVINGQHRLCALKMGGATEVLVRY